MNTLTNILLTFFLIAYQMIGGCAKLDSPTVPFDQDITPTSFPQLNSPGDDQAEKRSNLNPENLIGIWTLSGIFPSKEGQKIPNLSYTFEEGGSGRFSKGEESMDFNWSIEEIVLSFTVDEKTWKVAAYLVGNDLYTCEWVDKDIKWGDKGDKGGGYDKDGDWDKKKDKQDKKYVLKMKFTKEQ
jgi:hypothetical protein